MFKKERLNKIHHLLIDHEYLSVNYLAKKLQVSDVTIRRDLKELELQGILYREHGVLSLVVLVHYSSLILMIVISGL